MSAGDNSLDVQAALARLGGNTAIYAKLLDRFRSNYPAGAPQLSEALAAGDRVAAEREAHTLKGLAGSLGAVALQDVCYEMEKACKGGAQDDECNRLLEQVREALACALKAIDEHLGGGQAPQQAPVLSKDALRDKLVELLDLLEENDARAASLFATLLPSITKYDPDMAVVMRQAIDNFDFNQALGLTAAMLGQLG